MPEVALELKKFFLMWKKLLVWLNITNILCISVAMTLNARCEFAYGTYGGNSSYCWRSFSYYVSKQRYVPPQNSKIKVIHIALSQQT